MASKEKGLKAAASLTPEPEGQIVVTSTKRASTRGGGASGGEVAGGRQARGRPPAAASPASGAALLEGEAGGSKRKATGTRPRKSAV